MRIIVHMILWKVPLLSLSLSLSLSECFTPPSPLQHRFSTESTNALSLARWFHPLRAKWDKSQSETKVKKENAFSKEDEVVLTWSFHVHASNSLKNQTQKSEIPTHWKIFSEYQKDFISHSRTGLAARNDGWRATAFGESQGWEVGDDVESFRRMELRPADGELMAAARVRLGEDANTWSLCWEREREWRK